MRWVSHCRTWSSSQSPPDKEFETDSLAAADFFTVEVLTLLSLVRYVVFFVMKLKTRTVEIVGVTRQPDEA